MKKSTSTRSKEKAYSNLTYIEYKNKNVVRIKLFSFKFEVGKTNDELIDIAHKSLISGNSDFVIANDKEEMKRNNSHIAYVIDRDKVCSEAIKGKEAIAETIIKTIMNIMQG